MFLSFQISESKMISNSTMCISNSSTDRDCEELSILHYANVTEDSTIDTTFNYIAQFQYYGLCVVGGPVAVLGMIGNFLAIIVLSSGSMRSTASCYLRALAVFDTFVLISMVLCFTFPIYSRSTNQILWYAMNYPYINSYAYYIALTAQTCSIYTIVAFTIERYIAVCRPLSVADLCTVKKSRTNVLLVILFAAIYNLPRLFEHKVEYIFDKSINISIPYIALTKFGRSAAYQQVYFIYLHLSVMFLIPSGILVVLNPLMIRAVKQSGDEHLRNCTPRSNIPKRNSNLTLMAMSVIVVFLVCQLPSVADNICYAIFSEQTHYMLPRRILNVFGTLMVITNSAANFYLYCLFGKKFRRVFCCIFSKCYQKQSKSDYIKSKIIVQESTKSVTVSRKDIIRGENTFRSCEEQYNVMVMLGDVMEFGHGNKTGNLPMYQSTAEYSDLRTTTKLNSEITQPVHLSGDDDNTTL